MPVGFALRNTRAEQASWLSELRRNCHNLRTLAFNFHLASVARTEFNLLLLSLTLEELLLGPLVLEIIDDWTIAIILAQPVLRVLHLEAPITPNSLQILSDQCKVDSRLDNLQELTACFDIDVVDNFPVSSIISPLQSKNSLRLSFDTWTLV
jgi:hypothetical protein